MLKKGNIDKDSSWREIKWLFRYC